VLTITFSHSAVAALSSSAESAMMEQLRLTIRRENWSSSLIGPSRSKLEKSMHWEAEDKLAESIIWGWPWCLLRHQLMKQYCSKSLVNCSCVCTIEHMKRPAPYVKH
jgi:hypothetical protein